MSESIPIYIICYNNYKYVQNTIRQLQNRGGAIHIIDNGSTDMGTLEYLKNCEYPIMRTDNVQPKSLIERLRNETSSPFCITDPDLEFNPDLPSDFIMRLLDISQKFSCSQVGFALRIDDYDAMYHDLYYASKTIYDWERQFWESPIRHDEYELYSAEIDTTFSLINPNFTGMSIRVAGIFTARHLPWYVNNPIMDAHDLRVMYSNARHSTSGSLIMRNLVCPDGGNSKN